MRKTSEMYVVSRMQTMVQIRAHKLVSRPNDILFFCCINSFGALGVESPHGGAINAEVWLRASTQIFYSLGVGFGSLVAFGSYGAKGSDFVKEASKVSFINCGTSIFAGFVVFPILGQSLCVMRGKNYSTSPSLFALVMVALSANVQTSSGVEEATNNLSALHRQASTAIKVAGPQRQARTGKQRIKVAGPQTQATTEQ